MSSRTTRPSRPGKKAQTSGGRKSTRRVIVPGQVDAPAVAGPSDRNTWATRIVGHTHETPESLLAHPFNYRRHPGEQRDALRGSLTSFGWVKSVTVNRRTQHVIDGHARIEEAISKGEGTVPVEWVDMSEDEERIALAVLDPISAMATHDDAILHDLVAGIAIEDEHLRALVDTLTGQFTVDATDPAALATGDRTTLETMTFNLSSRQASIVRSAIEKAVDAGHGSSSPENENRNGNALAWVCEEFVRVHDAERDRG